MTQLTQRSASRVFVPLIGFRPAGTRVLREPAETTAHGTKLRVFAVAAAPDRTDALVEWERTGDPATCPPDSQLLVYSNTTPLDKGATATLVVGMRRLDALTMRRRASQVSHGSIGAIDAITFPPLPGDADIAELRIGEAAQEWRASFTVGPGEIMATALAAEVARDGIVVRATALSRYRDELIVELEVEGPSRIRQIGAPLLTGAGFASENDELRRVRRAELRRVIGDRARQIALEDDRGKRNEEIRRLFTLEPQQAANGRFTTRFAVVFETPSADAKSATVVVPFVDISDPEGSVTADLRNAPQDLDVGGHRFRVVSAEPNAKDHRLVIVEGMPSPRPPRFIHPAGMRGADGNAAFPNPSLGEQVSFGATVADPPIVTFTGAVLRVDGPLRLEIPLS